MKDSITIAVVHGPSFQDGRSTLTPRLKLTVNYMKGGMNYFNGQTMPRGYIVSVEYDRVSDDGFRSLLLDGKGNPSAVVEHAKRFNAKKLQEIAQRVIDGKYEALVSGLYAQAIEIRKHAWPEGGFVTAATATEAS